ncbi:hypothetical protein BKA56DRAFT_484625 [Ilyonectria sp. MPI-CAGE-AT-0026]|nr:hypothetical protein BKA56DRAFT_484625 [Ilyonectria sp. MPI-CAGE-AT-0026]
MAEHQLTKIRPLGKLEQISAAAHHIDFFTNTGLSVHYTAPDPSIVRDLEQTVYNALAQVVRLHPVLFAVPVVADTKEPHWGRLPFIDLKQAVSIVQRSRPPDTDGDGTDGELDELLGDQHNTSFKAGYGTRPVWRLVILQDYGTMHQFTACFIAHHSMTDGTGLQIFHNSFQKALCDVSSGPLTSRVEHIILSRDDPIAPSLEQLHPLPIPANPPKLDVTVPNEWTGSPVELPCRTRYASLSLPPHAMNHFTQECRRHKVAPAAALPSLVARLLYSNLPTTTESLTCNIPVSLRSDLPPKSVNGVLGNFIDAFKVKLLRSDLDVQDIGDRKIADSSTLSSYMGTWNHARKIQEATRNYFSNVSPSGEPYANVAFFKLIPDIGAALTATIGKPRGESFEVSNLGSFSKPTNLNDVGPIARWKSGKVLCSRCAYAAGGPLVICVLSGDENIGFGVSWQEGSIADDVVENIIEGLKMYLQL